ncbi:uncharacterized protein CEXT_483531 [Caerostris extrusa]|uniref:GATA zinc finger domain-containing protein 14-like n=1 Tax=Caerostris extrusa TaxID=172846 RepID=A0AAV4VGF3_CAEEX|nr:uncharacterized protein CEXT_483531 [Caerostris extrusa]
MGEPEALTTSQFAKNIPIPKIKMKRTWRYQKLGRVIFWCTLLVHQMFENKTSLHQSSINLATMNKSLFETLALHCFSETQVPASSQSTTSSTSRYQTEETAKFQVRIHITTSSTDTAFGRIPSTTSRSNGVSAVHAKEKGPQLQTIPLTLNNVPEIRLLLPNDVHEQLTNIQKLHHNKIILSNLIRNTKVQSGKYSSNEAPKNLPFNNNNNYDNSFKEPQDSSFRPQNYEQSHNVEQHSPVNTYSQPDPNGYPNTITFPDQNIQKEYNQGQDNNYQNIQTNYNPEQNKNHNIKPNYNPGQNNDHQNIKPNYNPGQNNDHQIIKPNYNQGQNNNHQNVPTNYNQGQNNNHQNVPTNYNQDQNNNPQNIPPNYNQEISQSFEAQNGYQISQHLDARAPVNQVKVQSFSNVQENRHAYNTGGQRQNEGQVFTQKSNQPGVFPSYPGQVQRGYTENDVQTQISAFDVQTTAGENVASDTESTNVARDDTTLLQQKELDTTGDSFTTSTGGVQLDLQLDARSDRSGSCDCSQNCAPLRRFPDENFGTSIREIARSLNADAFSNLLDFPIKKSNPC